jgi:hypothetical protein
MNLYATEIKAINPVTGEMTTWCGPHVPGISEADAQDYCQNNGLGYCSVIGLLIAEIPCKPGTFEPDWENEINYENPRLN